MAISLVAKNRLFISSATSGSFTISSGTSPHRLLVVLALIDDAIDTVTGVTYAGVALTKAVDLVHASAANRAQLWYLIDPASGLNTIAVTANSADNYEMVAATFSSNSGAFTAGPTASAQGSAITSSLSVTVAKPAVVVSGMIHEATDLITGPSGQTRLYDIDQGAWNTGSSYVIRSASGSQTMSESGSLSDVFVHVVASFEEPGDVPSNFPAARGSGLARQVIATGASLAPLVEVQVSGASPGASSTGGASTVLPSGDGFGEARSVVVPQTDINANLTAAIARAMAPLPQIFGQTVVTLPVSVAGPGAAQLITAAIGKDVAVGPGLASGTAMIIITTTGAAGIMEAAIASGLAVTIVARGTTYDPSAINITNVVQRGGAYTAQTHLYLSDRSGRKIQRLPFDVPIRGTINFNNDAEIKRKFSLDVNHPHRFDAYKDFLIPEVTITDSAGNRTTRPLGHFIVMRPRTTLDPSRFSGSIEAKDSTWLLAVDTIRDYEVIPKGTDSGEAARTIALATFSADRCVLPDTGVPLAEDFTVSPGSSRYSVITDLYELASWYQPWLDSDGILRTMKYLDLRTAQAHKSYSTRDRNVELVPPIEEDPDMSRVKNRVTVRNISPDRDPIYATVEVTNLSSPVHPMRLGDGERPLILAGPPVDDSQVPTREAALEKAYLLLQDGASYYRKLNIRTVIDLDADAHDVIGIHAVHHGAEFTGNWLRRAWDVELEGVTALTTSEITRIEDVG